MKSYELLDTKHPDLFRVVDRDGNWENYFYKPTGVYLVGITTSLSRGYPKGPGYDAWLSQHTPQERDEILRLSGEKGDKVHRLIDMILSTPKGGSSFTLDRSTQVYNRQSGTQETLSNGEWDAIVSWTRFWLAHAPIVFASELSVYNLTTGYAGTGDCTLMLTKACEVKTCKCNDLIGKIGVYDWKTGNGIYASFWSQLAAIASADNIREYIPHGKAIEYGAVLRLGTRHVTTGGYELKTVDVDGLTQAFSRFVAAKSLGDFENPPFDPSDIYEIPDHIVIPVNVGDLSAPAEKRKKTRKPRTPKAPKKEAPVGAPKKRGKKTKNVTQ